MVRALSSGVVVLAFLSACSGKTERGGAAGSDVTPAQQPANGAASPPAAGVEPVRHLLMVVELEPATHAARTLAARSVDLPLPHRRGPAQPAPWRVDVLNGGGTVLYTAPLPDAATVRGEFRDPRTGELSGVIRQARTTAVTLRLPWLDGATDVRVVSLTDAAPTELGRVPYPRAKP